MCITLIIQWIIVLGLRFAHNGITWLYKYLAMIMQEKNKSYEKNKLRIRRIRFYSAKVTSIQKSPQITHRTYGDSSQSPYPYHTHTHGNPHGNLHTHGSPGSVVYYYICMVMETLFNISWHNNVAVNFIFSEPVCMHISGSHDDTFLMPIIFSSRLHS